MQLPLVNSLFPKKLELMRANEPRRILPRAVLLPGCISPRLCEPIPARDPGAELQYPLGPSQTDRQAISVITSLAKLLDIRPQFPLLFIEGISYLLSDASVEILYIYNRADLFKELNEQTPPRVLIFVLIFIDFQTL